jgi:hypothetical protein
MCKNFKTGPFVTAFAVGVVHLLACASLESCSYLALGLQQQHKWHTKWHRWKNQLDKEIHWLVVWQEVRA